MRISIGMARGFAALLLTCVMSTLYGQPQFQAYINDPAAMESAVAGVPITIGPNVNLGKVAFLHNTEINPASWNQVELSAVDPATGGIDFSGPDIHNIYFAGWNSYEKAVDIIQASDGGYVFLVNTDNNAVANAPFGGQDIIVTRTDQFGNVIWCQRLGSSVHDEGRALIQRSDNKQILVVGWTDMQIPGTTFLGINVLCFSLDFASGGKIWDQMYSGFFDDYGIDMVEMSTTGFFPKDYVITGHSGTYSGNPGPGSNNMDIFFMKIDSMGIPAGVVSYGDPNLDYDYARNIVQLPNARYLVGGYSLSAGGNQNATSIMVTVGFGLLMYKQADVPTFAEDCMAYEDPTNGNLMMIGNLSSSANSQIFFLPYLTTTVGPAFGRIYGSVPTPVNEKNINFSYLPPAAGGPGYMSWGSEMGSGTNVPNVWYVGVDNMGAKVTCDKVQIFNMSNPPPIIKMHTVGNVKLLLDKGIVNPVAVVIKPETVECAPSTPCFADTSKLYMQISSNVIYTAYTVWPAKVNVWPNVTVTVTNGAILDITNSDVILGPNSQIVFTDTSCIRANNSVFRPCEKDSTWLGIDFTDNSGGIVDECVFKSAYVALYVVKTAQIKITNNEFVNCNIAVETINAGKSFWYTEGITGNTVIIDDEHPVYQFLPNFTGFRLNTTFFKGLLSQNDFINATQVNTTTAQFTAMDFFFCQATASENKITNAQFGIRMTGCTPIAGTSTIENNEIEYTDESYTVGAIGIFITDMCFVIVEGNEVNYSSGSATTAPLTGIHFQSTFNLVAFDNEIKGFQEGIKLDKCNIGQIHRNTLDDCLLNSIIVNNSTSNITVSENVITMDNSDPGTQTGIRFNQTFSVATPTNSIESNCIFDTEFAIFLTETGGGQSPVPRVYNNFLYNYNLIGLLSVNMFGTIGTGCTTDAALGRNSFITNTTLPVGFFPLDVAKIPAVPVITLGGNHTTGDNVAGTAWYTPGSVWQLNPGVLPPAGSPTCNRGSRATCSHESYNKTDMTSVDLYNQLVQNNYPLVEEFGFVLRPDFKSWIESLPQTDRLKMISMMLGLLSGKPSEIQKLGAAVTSELIVSADEFGLWNYHYGLATGEKAAALAALNSITPTTPEISDLHFILSFAESMNASGISEFVSGSSILDRMRDIRDLGGMYARYACNFLFPVEMQASSCIPAPVYSPELPEFEVMSYPVGQDWLQVYPNPNNGNFRLQWTIAETEGMTISVVNSLGQVVNHKPLQEVAGYYDVNLSDRAPGVYFVSISGNEGVVEMEKILVEK